MSLMLIYFNILYIYKVYFIYSLQSNFENNSEIVMLYKYRFFIYKQIKEDNYVHRKTQSLINDCEQSYSICYIYMS